MHGAYVYFLLNKKESYTIIHNVYTVDLVKMLLA